MNYTHADWRWVDPGVVLAVHDEQLVEHGGASGTRDSGLLESSLAHSRHLATYGSPGVFELAASYGFGLARNHPFIDGNKRTAFVIMLLFLYLNGYRLQATDAQKVLTVLAVAEGQLNESGLAEWLRTHSASRAALHQPKTEYKTDKKVK